jgi:hypothetical protein
MLPDSVRPGWIQIDRTNKKIYWIDGPGGKRRIRRSALDGSNPETLLDSRLDPQGLALGVGENKMYWSDPHEQAVYRANLDGTGCKKIVEANYQPGLPAMTSCLLKTCAPPMRSLWIAGTKSFIGWMPTPPQDQIMLHAPRSQAGR